MAELTVPQLNSNDETYVLVEWLIPASGSVSRGDAVATIETSKAITDVVCDADGFLVRRVDAGAVCRPGDVIGHITAAPEPAAADGLAAPAPAQDSLSGQVITRPAQELIDLHGISADAVASLGKKLIKAVDIQSLLDTGPGDSGMTLTPHQLAVARTVSRSHTTIPDAFLLTKVSVGEMTSAQRRLVREAKAYIGLPELVISAVSRLWTHFPACFATVRDDLTLVAAQRPDIGVTIDVGTGLYVPTIRDAASLTPAEISAVLMEMRVRAMRRTLRDADLAPAQLTVTLQLEPGIVLSQPVIFPGQVCALSMAAVQRGVVLGPDGQVQPEDYFYLGLAHDHRILNGRDAAIFLTAIAETLQRPLC